MTARASLAVEVPTAAHAAGRIELEGRARCGDRTWVLRLRLPDGPGREPDRLDAWAVAWLPLAQTLGADLDVQGRMTVGLPERLEAFARHWADDSPQFFRPVAVRPASLVDARPPRPGVVSAFSGGVDSTHTLWSRNVAGRSEPRVSRAILVHGFDIPADQENGFAAAQSRVAPLAAAAEVPLDTVWTDFRRLPLDWTLVHGAALAFVLTSFAADHGLGLIPGSRHRGESVAGLGSNWRSDPLLGSGDFTIVHDGEELPRLAKVADLAQWSPARAAIRVCWDGPDPGSNCGRCVKCVRARVLFLQVGCPELPAFPGPPIEEAWRRLVILGGATLRAMEREAAFAWREPGRYPWARAARRSLRRSRHRQWMRRIARPLVRLLPGPWVVRLGAWADRA